MNHRSLLSILVLISAVGCAEKKPVPNGEIQPIARIQLDTNRVIEVIGLRRWTVDMIQDSLRRYAAGQTLDSRPGKHGGHSGRVLSDGRIEVAGQTFESPSSSAIFVRNAGIPGCEL